MVEKCYEFFVLLLVLLPKCMTRLVGTLGSLKGGVIMQEAADF